MKVTICYLSCGCVVWIPDGGVTIGANGRCLRCGYSDIDTVIREQRTIKEPVT